jgi:hypothetical protein
MHIWSDIIIREFAMLVTLFAMGSGPASFLSQRFGTAARVAMAPVLGLCLGTCVFTTVLWFFAARNTYWLLPIAALLSVTVAAWRTTASIRLETGVHSGRAMVATVARRLGSRDTIALVVVCVVVAAPFSYTLHERHSVGPTGFEVWDSFAFTAEADGAVNDSFGAAVHKANIFGQNFAQMYWAGTASQDQQIDAVPLSANLNELLGLHSTDTQTLFMIAFLISGALGAFGAVRYGLPRPSWAAPFAGILFAGPFFLQLIADGSQPATCGLALILPIVAVGMDTLRMPRVASLFLLALLAAGLMALYPLFVPAMGISAGIVLVIAGVRAWWRGRLDRRALFTAVGAVLAVLALGIVFDLVGFLRDARYWKQVLEGGYYLAGLPQYHLPYSVLPGWLLQTREFYFLTELGSTTPTQIAIGVLLPLLFVAAIIFGLKRRPIGLVLLLPLLVYAVMAEYTSAAHSCPYCTDRALLPIAPLTIGLLVLGVAALATAPSWWLKLSGLVLAVIIVVTVGERTRQERLRFADGSYFLEASDRALLSHLPMTVNAVDLEAYGQDPRHAPGELELTYLLAFERSHGHVSVPSEYTDYAGLAYLTNQNPRNPQFDPNYRYVLTRLGNVQTGRHVIARTGSIALEERSRPLDVTLVSGVAVPLERLDSSGLAWVQGPLHMIVVGGKGAPAWVALRLQASVAATVPPQPGVRATVSAGGAISACVRATGTAPVRKATITLGFPLAPGIIPNEPFTEQEPPQGVQLLAMRAVSHCTPASAATA